MDSNPVTAGARGTVTLSQPEQEGQ